MRERILNAQNDLQYCKTKVTYSYPAVGILAKFKHINNELLLLTQDMCGSEDNDSALSSAPPSLSPQPGTQPNSPDVWQTVSDATKVD